jgi:23S rRNA pseudouridine2605 synthase
MEYSRERKPGGNTGKRPRIKKNQDTRSDSGTAKPSGDSRYPLARSGNPSNGNTSRREGTGNDRHDKYPGKREEFSRGPSGRQSRHEENSGFGYQKSYEPKGNSGAFPEKKSFDRDHRDFHRSDRKPFKPYKASSRPASVKGDGLTRLNKYIANAGICSRREADELITAGLVSINDVVITELGTKVKPGDVVKYNGERLRSEKKIYILLNKPKDFVTTSDDPEGRSTVMDLVKYPGKERIYPVGRLDRNTTGVLMLTNDGDLAARLIHPKYNVKKIYHVFLDRDITEEDFAKVAEGLELEDGFIKPDSIRLANPLNRKELGVEIHSGRNRIVRRIFEQVGYKVFRLDRVYFAGLTKKNLPRGKWRILNEREISLLKMNAFR